MINVFIGMVLCFVTIGSASLAEAVPLPVGFSGRLVNAEGPVTGSVDIDLALLNEVGAVVWSNSYNVEAQEGLIFIQLDKGISLAFSGESLSLEVTVNGTKLGPALPILSVPYAHRAAVADKLGELTADQVVTTESLDAFATDVVKRNELDIFAKMEDHVSDDELTNLLSSYAQLNQCVSPNQLSSSLSPYARKDQNTTFSNDLTVSGRFRVSGSCAAGDVLTFDGDSLRCSAPPKIECDWSGDRYVSYGGDGGAAFTNGVRIYCQSGKVVRLQRVGG